MWNLKLLFWWKWCLWPVYPPHPCPQTDLCPVLRYIFLWVFSSGRKQMYILFLILLLLVWLLLKASLQWCGCHQTQWPWPLQLWFHSRCARVSGITWGSPGLLAGTAALLKQVSNGSTICSCEFIATTWICTLVNPLPFILQSVTSYLSNWCYRQRGSDPPSSPPWGLAPAFSPALRPHVSGSIRARLVLFYAPLHIELSLTLVVMSLCSSLMTDLTQLTMSLHRHQGPQTLGWKFRMKIIQLCNGWGGGGPKGSN